MENSEARSSQRVQVTVIIKPLTTSELLVGYTDCISVVHGARILKFGVQNWLQVDSQYFAFDYVYGGSTSSPSSTLYDDCVSPLVDALFDGHNATILAYGRVLLDEVNDLLVPNLPKGAALLKPARVPIQIRKTMNGITVAGVTETEVRTKEEMAKHLSCSSHSCHWEY
nr:kinesin-like protein kin-4c [Quercus suber]